MPETKIRGNTIKYLRVPDEVKHFRSEHPHVAQILIATLLTLQWSDCHRDADVVKGILHARGVFPRQDKTLCSILAHEQQ